jgi:hypothetical protein
MKRSNKYNGIMRSIARRISNLPTVAFRNKVLRKINYEGKVIY